MIYNPPTPSIHLSLLPIAFSVLYTFQESVGAVVYLPTYTYHLFVTQSMFLDLSFILFWEVGNIIIEFRFTNPLDRTW